MGSIVETCCILHNIIVTTRRENCRGTSDLRLSNAETELPTDLVRLSVGNDEESVWRHWRNNVDRTESADDQERLRNALIEHIWAKRGGDVEESDGDSFKSNS
jgi:hypothetical protein